MKDCDKRFCMMQWCSGYGMLTLLYGAIYVGLIYFQIIKPIFGKQFREGVVTPMGSFLSNLFSSL